MNRAVENTFKYFKFVDDREATESEEMSIGEKCDKSAINVTIGIELTLAT